MKQDPRATFTSATGLDPRQILWLVIGIAFLLRLPLIFLELFHHPDEAWQYLEPAHGLVTGWKVVPWEYRAGIRTWLIPAFLAGPMAAGKLLWPDTIHYLIPVRLTLALVSLGIVAVGTALALRITRWHGLIAGLMLATAFDLVYFSARALSDSIAPALFLPALWLMSGKWEKDGWRFLAGGFLLGLVFAIRFQLAPVLGLTAVIACRGDKRRWLHVIAGGVFALMIDGLVDLVQGEMPLRWIIENFRINLIQNKSAFYGTEPPLWYVANQIRVWGWSIIPILCLALAGGRRMPSVALIAIVNMIVHAAIPHKEYRFVFLSITLMWLLAGVGAADLAAMLVSRWPRARRWLPLAGVTSALLVAGGVAAAPGKAVWSSSRRVIALMRGAHDVPGICGLAFLQPSNALKAAYVYYDRATPIYVFDQPDSHADVRRLGSAFNAVVTSPDRAALLGPGYRQAKCFVGRHARRERNLSLLPEHCLYVRQGSCGAPLPPEYGINAALIRSGE
ncbi:hypothetical protein [Sphingomonas sp.]|uniref:hypothetical protein n=1 Tax=Sphingomonas sp. TaxID=28214 RepID=UPI0025F5E5C0|nr:hypothetical protein [Sphingomonas sp.]